MMIGLPYPANISGRMRIIKNVREAVGSFLINNAKFLTYHFFGAKCQTSIDKKQSSTLLHPQLRKSAPIACFMSLIEKVIAP